MSMMMMTDEAAALETFVRTRGEGDFRGVVEGHIDWVYSAARRMVREEGLAEDVAQAVFLLLWQRPEKARGKSLSAWLFSVTRYCAANALRARRRREMHERRAPAMKMEEVEPEWEEIAPVVEPLVAKLRAGEREVVLLRFYQGKSMGEIGAVLGISEDAARKRVGYAVEKLRGMLKREGIFAREGALGALMLGRMTEAAPIVLRAKIFAGGAGVSSSVTGLAQGARQMMVMMKVKVGVLVGAVALVIGGGSWLAAAGMNGTAAEVKIGVSASAPAATGQAAGVAIDLSAPDKTMESFCEALKEGDREKLYACLVPEVRGDVSAVHEILEFNLAMNQVVVEAQKKFGPKATAASFGVLGIDAVGEMIANTVGWNGTNSKVEGGSAEISVTMPPEMLAAFPKGAREIVEIWSGAPIRMKKIDSEWRFDVLHTMKVVLMGKNAKRVTEQEEMAAFGDSAKVLRQLAGDIREGKVESVEQARAELRIDMQETMSGHGMKGVNMMIVPADYKENP